MLSKISMIAIFVAVCIDRSFEEPRVFECDCDEDVLSVVYFQDLRNGYIPIVVTNTKTEKETVNQVKKIKNFFDTKVPGIKMIEVFYPHAGASRGTAALVYYANNKAMTYPFVGIMKDHHMLRKVVVGFNEPELNDLFEQARTPRLPEKCFHHSPLGFSFDLYQKMKKWKREKEIDPRVIEAAEKPDVPRTTTAFPATQSDSQQSALVSGTRRTSATQSDSWPPVALDSGTGTSLVSQSNANKRQIIDPTVPPKIDKRKRTPYFPPIGNTQPYNYPTGSPTFDSNTSPALPPTANPQSALVSGTGTSLVSQHNAKKRPYRYPTSLPTLGTGQTLVFQSNIDTQRNIYPPTTGSSGASQPSPNTPQYNYQSNPPKIGSSTSLTFEPDPNTPQYNNPPTYDKNTSWTFDNEPDPESYIYNYPTTPTFDTNTNWVLPPIEYPQHLFDPPGLQQYFDPPGPPTTGSSSSSRLPATGNLQQSYNPSRPPTTGSSTSSRLPATGNPPQSYNPPRPPTTGSSTSSRWPPTGNQGTRKYYD